MKTPERRSGVFIINFEHISHLVQAFLLLTLNMKLTAGFILQIIHHALLQGLFEKYLPLNPFLITQKMKFSIKDFFSKCGQISCFLRILSNLLKKSLMENFIFCVLSEKYSLFIPAENIRMTVFSRNHNLAQLPAKIYLFFKVNDRSIRKWC